MKSKLFPALLAVPLCLVLFSTAGRAQTAPVTGQILSKGVTTANNSVFVFTTPQSGHFILTQFCGSANNVSLFGGTFNFIATTASGLTNPGETCISFNPGYALPTNQPLSCQRQGLPAGLSCSISGVLEPDAG